jgi:tRNA A37 threonylcarbamoyladenosine dehydratase
MKPPEWQSRTELLIGKEALLKLKNSHVFVLGLGGVGAYTAELLCRAGVGRLTIADGDKVQESNINRQLIALNSTIGEKKAEVMARRLREISPETELNVINEFLQEDAMDAILQTPFDFVVDAIDTLTPKVFIILKTLEKGYPIVSSMGAGGKLDPSQVMVSDISKSYNCRLAHSLRKQLHKRGIRKGFKVVFSPESVAKTSVKLVDNEKNKKSTVGTISYMPALFGCVMASVVIMVLVSGSDKP